MNTLKTYTVRRCTWCRNEGKPWYMGLKEGPEGFTDGICAHHVVIVKNQIIAIKGE
jgi:hypothetical protein